MKCPGCGYHTQSKSQTVCKMCGSDLTGDGGHGGHGPGKAAPAAPVVEAPARARPVWERHMLLRVGAPPMELKIGKTFTVGRSAEADLNIPSPRVSRQHAEIVWHEDKPVLRDLGSQNGTTLNGHKVTGEYALVDHDELGIGPYTCSYRCLSGYGSVGKAQGLLDTALTTKPMVGDSLSGQLSQTSLFEVLQMLEVSQKTGQVDLFFEERVGRVVLDEGRIIHASEGDLEGAPALHAMLAWTDGMFRFGAAIEGDPAQNMPGKATILMIEAVRRLAADGPGA